MTKFAQALNRIKMDGHPGPQKIIITIWNDALDVEYEGQEIASYTGPGFEEHAHTYRDEHLNGIGEQILAHFDPPKPTTKTFTDEDGNVWKCTLVEKEEN